MLIAICAVLATWIASWDWSWGPIGLPFFVIAALAIAFGPLGVVLVVPTAGLREPRLQKAFFVLTGVSAAGVPLCFVLHKVISTFLSARFSAAFWKRHPPGPDEPVFIFLATFVCPALFVIGVVGSIALRYERRQDTPPSATAPRHTDTDSTPTPHPRRRGPATVVCLAAVCMFLLSLAVTTDWLYSKTEDRKVLQPANIISGYSKAPNQYRVLVPLIYRFVNLYLGIDPARSDRAVIFLSILAAYVAAGALFYRSSGSLGTMMLASLALLGCFCLGMVYKSRQEFFEVAFVSAALLVITSVPRTWVMYCLLAAITLLGSLNRETYVFCITGVTAHIVWQQRSSSTPRWWPHVAGLAALSLISAFSYVGPRWFYGPADYHGAFWRYTNNLRNLRSVTNPFNLLHLGAGVLFAYLATVALGNRKYLPFILGYAFPMLCVASLISCFGEHRVFYPLMALLLGSIVGFAAERNPRAARLHLSLPHNSGDAAEKRKNNDTAARTGHHSGRKE